MTDTIAMTRRGGIRVVAAATVLAVVAGLTLAPPSIAAPARRAFVRLVAAVAEPVLQWIPAEDAEQVLNTILFVPLGATVALLLRRRLWLIAVVAGFALSAAVEYAQGSIPGRVPDPADVLWNTVGGAIGVAVVTVPRLIAAAVRRARQRGRVTRT